MRIGEMVAHAVDREQVASAINNEAIHCKSDDELLELLECLYTRVYLEDKRHLPLINQCISINAELLNRYYRHSSRAIAGLALIAALLGVGQLCMFLLR